MSLFKVYRPNDNCGPLLVEAATAHAAGLFVLGLGGNNELLDYVVVTALNPDPDHPGPKVYHEEVKETPVHRPRGQIFLREIKKRRAATGEGLAEAKAWVEENHPALKPPFKQGE
jgi:hypothetical protein